MKIAIIGAGWLGCHLALQLKNLNLTPFVFETQNEIFRGASGFNQCRLHLGFHYPRAEVTRSEAQRCFIPFSEHYKDFIVDVPNNLYAVAEKDSLINFSDFCELYRNEGLDFKTLDKKDFSLKNIAGVISTDEKAIDLNLVKKYFAKELEGFLKLGTKIETLENRADKISLAGESFDYAINCSYQQFHSANNFKCFYEPCIMLRYKKHLGQNFALTIVDGPFGSIYPCPDEENNGYYLSTVPHTSLGNFQTPEEAYKLINNLTSSQISQIKNNMENLISTYYPNFENEFEYLDKVTSVKTKVFSKNDERNSFFSLNGRLIQAFIGKLSQVCLIEKEILKIL